MRPDRMTTKSQEAFRAAADLASRRGNPELFPSTCSGRFSNKRRRGPPLFQKAGADPALVEGESPEHRDAAAGLGRVEPNLSRRTLALLPRRRTRRKG